MREIKFRAWYKSGQFMSNNVHYEYEWEDIICSYEDENSRYVLMQYSGLKDKNGKEIYEGDILKVTHKDTDTTRIGEVIYGSLGRYQIKGKGIHCAFNHITAYEWEVIGNIYENPNLLESK